jgi:hypothetical protein
MGCKVVCEKAVEGCVRECVRAGLWLQSVSAARLSAAPMKLCSLLVVIIGVKYNRSLGVYVVKVTSRSFSNKKASEESEASLALCCAIARHFCW